MIDNLALYMVYAVFGAIGAVWYKKNRWFGLLGGLIVASLLLTIFALLLGG